MELIKNQHGSATNESILDTPVCTLRQTIELIQQRLKEEAKFQAQMVEWQTKALGGLLAGLAQDEKVSKNMIKIVTELRLVSDEDEVIKDTRSLEEVMEQGAIIDPDKLPSTDRLFRAMSAK